MQQQIELLYQQFTEAAQQRNAIDDVTHGKAEGNLRARLFLLITLLFTVYKVRALHLVLSEEFTVNYVHRLHRSTTLKSHEVVVHAVLQIAHTNAMCCDDLSPTQRTLATVNGTRHSHHTTKNNGKVTKGNNARFPSFRKVENATATVDTAPHHQKTTFLTALASATSFSPPPLPLRSFSSSRKKALQKRKYLSNFRTAV